MRSRDVLTNGIDYSVFDNPYTGLGAMVLIQAADDLKYLKSKGCGYRDGTQIRRLEIVSFFHSDLAEVIADALHLDTRDMKKFANTTANLTEEEEKRWSSTAATSTTVATARNVVERHAGQECSTALTQTKEEKQKKSGLSEKKKKEEETHDEKG